MADSDDDVPGLDVEDEEIAEPGRGPQKEKTTTIPNFKGKVPDAEKDEDSKGNLQINWDGDDFDESEDEDDEFEEGDPELAGEVGEEFAKARREALREKRERRKAEEEGSDDEEVLEEEELWNFPEDKEKWNEDDIREEWAEAWGGDEKTGFDPDLVDDWDEIEKQWQQGEGPPLRPWYVPYRKHYPLIPEDHPDIQTPQDVVEELDRYEEFLTWASYIFKDGSSYEGTVFDDLAHGKGVYITALEFCRYEGEWFQNAMEGHGVLEADLPVYEPPPGSEAAKRWRAQGKLLNTDFLDDEDKEWIRMDVEDQEEIGDSTIDPNPWEDDEAWVKKYGEKPEKGNYRYAGQWKHSRMHGCGVYEVNGKPLYGQFYFGELLPDKGDCDEHQVAIHSGLAEIAAAKARMFINKPDGMVREYKGPYTDPSHPYMYEAEDLWMAPGFINAFYEVPEEWRRYVEEVDEEQELWLNSFIKSPFRIPMPPELEYQWAQDDEFVVLSNRDSNPMRQYPENLDPDVEGDILLHTPTGHLINWAEDPEGNLRFFLQPYEEDGEVRPEKVIPLPLGFDEFMGIVDEEGKVLDESRRGLSLEERKKLEKGDKKKERKEKFKAKIEEMKQKSQEKIKEIETDLYIKDLERQLEDHLIEESYKAELEALHEDDEEVAEEGAEVPPKAKVGTKVVSHAKTEREQSSGEDDDEDEDVEEDNEFPKKIVTPEGIEEDKDFRAEEEEGSDGEDDGGNDDDDEDDDDEDDEEDKKPRSFGKVAMVVPEQQSANLSLGDSSRPSFPTIFASLSLVPQMAVKQVVESSMRTVRRAWSLKFGAGQKRSAIVGHIGGKSIPRLQKIANVLSNSADTTAKVVRREQVVAPKNPRISSVRLSHSSRLPRSRLAQSKQMPAAGCLLAALKPHRSSPTSRRAMKHHRIQRLDSSPWVLPDMEVLSMAIPVQIL
ncbi:unnamed protein product [Calypogeia fissa]